MKFVTVVLAVCLFASCSAETCTGNNNLATECSHLTCSTNWHLTCMNGQCTCVENSPTDEACTTKAECDARQNWDCPINRRHCIDGRCRCTRF